LARPVAQAAEPAQSVSAQSIKPSQSSSRRSAHAVSLSAQVVGAADASPIVAPPGSMP
jgi:hypothetical protein